MIYCKKGDSWEWTPVHEEALELLVFAASNYQGLGLIHPTDPIQTE